MHGRLIHAPITAKDGFEPSDHGFKILDIGCGTGASTVCIAKQFPNALFYGVDMVPIPQIHEKPPTVEYIVGRFENLAAGGHQASHFRQTCLSVKC